MITSTIGKIFLKAYNEKYSTNYDAKTFFVKKYYPLFFDHNKYMMTAGNSPLENPKISWGDMLIKKKPYESKERRKERFLSLIDKIENTLPDASIAIGYQASDVKEYSTTSGQVTSINLQISKEDVYYSWIGAGLGVGVKGGYTLLFDKAPILLDIYDGWQLYRNLLNEQERVKGNQITTWNGQWLSHRYDNREYMVNTPMANFDPFPIKGDGTSLEVQSWTKILIGISQMYSQPQMMGYVYNLGQMNTTIGFIPFALNKIRRPIELYEKFFGMNNSRKAEPLWGTAFGFIESCKKGIIGLRSMEPKGLYDYIYKNKIPKFSDKEDTIISFNTYQIWLLAMLNNEELWDKSLEFAKELQFYRESGERGKTTNPQKVKEFLASYSKKDLIKSLTEIVSNAKNNDKIEELASLINGMVSENVPYFMTLVRFHYASINNKN